MGDSDNEVEDTPAIKGKDNANRLYDLRVPGVPAQDGPDFGSPINPYANPDLPMNELPMKDALARKDRCVDY